MSDILVYDKLLGPAAPALGWVPAPRYLLRRRRILRQLRNQPAGDVLEIGAGAGILLHELASRGHACTALETSSQARALIERISNASGRSITVEQAPRQEWIERFPLVMAFEVLEHIEDDRAALAQWASWLEPGGTLLLSVPAHPHQWNAADVWAGHYRRYQKDELLNRIADAGFRIEHVECFGFPLGNLTERMQARGIARAKSVVSDERQANNDRSGIERGHVLRWYPAMRSMPGKLVLRTAFAMQAVTSRLPLGNGWLVRATRLR